MKYIENVIKESLRLYPIATHLKREAEDDKYEDIIIPKGVSRKIFIIIISRHSSC